jgi:hypothetical protein
MSFTGQNAVHVSQKNGPKLSQYGGEFKKNFTYGEIFLAKHGQIWSKTGGLWTSYKDYTSGELLISKALMS